MKRLLFFCVSRHIRLLIDRNWDGPRIYKSSEWVSELSHFMVLVFDLFYKNFEVAKDFTCDQRCWKLVLDIVNGLEITGRFGTLYLVILLSNALKRRHPTKFFLHLDKFSLSSMASGLKRPIRLSEQAWIRDEQRCMFVKFQSWKWARFC